MYGKNKKRVGTKFWSDERKGTPEKTGCNGEDNMKVGFKNTV
jgi:hypothetical protein